MCYFVIVAFSPDARKQARGLLRSTCHMREVSNASFEASLPPGWITGYLSDEMCGCDMYAEPGEVDAGEQAEGTLRGLRIDVRRPIAELVRAAGSARVLAHFFSRGVEEEEVTAGEEQLSAGRFLAEGSLVQPDVWYEITDT